MPEQAFTALIGDLVASRESPHRAATQAALVDEAARLTDEHAADLAAPVALTAGDEVQALLRPGHAFEAMDLILRITDRLLAPDAQQPIVFGIGYGGLTTGPLPADPRDVNVALLDGPCFHGARTALGDAQQAGAWAAAAGFGHPFDRSLSALFHLMGELRAGWTTQQAHYVAAVRSERGRLVRGAQQRAAEAAGVSPSVISESLKAAHFQALVHGERAARLIFMEYEVAVAEGRWRRA